MDIDGYRVPFGMIFLPAFLTLANAFFLLGIHRNHGLPRLLKGIGFLSDKAKLVIAVWMVCALFDFSGPLQTVIHLVQQLRDQTMAGSGFLLVQFLGNRPRTFGTPQQPRLWSTAVCDMHILVV